MKDFLETGKIVGTHGLRGEIKVNPWCDSTEKLCKMKNLYLGENKVPLKINSAYPHKNIIVMSIDGVTDIESAKLLYGKILYLNRDDVVLEDDEYFIQDILGCRVFDSKSSECYGTVTDVLKTGANDVYQIERDGKTFLVPVIPDVVDSIDIKKREIYITPLNGLFD